MATRTKTVEQPQNEINLLNESEENIMSEEKMKRISHTSKIDFLNITPNADTPKWAIIGTAITSIENNYGAKTSDEHWVIETNERHSLDGYSLGTDLEQTAYKGDGVFEFVDDIMYYMKKGNECETTKIEVYKYRVDETGDTPKYDARLLKVLIVPDTVKRRRKCIKSKIQNSSTR